MFERLKMVADALRIEGPEARQPVAMGLNHRQALSDVVRMKCREQFRDHGAPGNVIFALEAASMLRWNAEPELRRLRDVALFWRAIGFMGAVGWFILSVLVVSGLCRG